MSFGSGGSGSGALSGDSDVALNVPADGQVLTYSSSVSKWANADTTASSNNGAAVFSAKDYGAKGDGSTDDTAALTSWANAANGRKAYLPSGTYLCTTGPIFSNIATELYGDGSNSVISVTNNTAQGIVFGNASSNNGVVAGGSVRNIKFQTSSGKPTARTGNAGLQLKNAIQVSVQGVTVTGFDMGFDLINNCYGSQFMNCRTIFSGNNVGINLRTGSQSGSDIAFYNCWIGGAYAAVFMSGGGGGYHFFGGQYAGGLGFSAVQDAYGTIVMGQDWLSGSTGESSCEFHGVSFEGTEWIWIVRQLDTGPVGFFGCQFNPTQSNAPAIGLFKTSNAKNGKLFLANCTFSGFWSASTLISISGQYADYGIQEVGTYMAAQQPTLNGTGTYMSSVALQAGLAGVSQVLSGSGVQTANVTATSKLQTGASASASTPGSVTKKLPIYDQNSTLLGYIPIYNTIT